MKKNYFGCVLPVKSNAFHHINLPNNFNLSHYQIVNGKGPFFYIENGNGAVESFLHSLFYSSLDEAKKFVSMDFDNVFDLKTFKERIGSYANYKYLSRGSFSLKSKSCIVNSVLFMDKKHTSISIVNFYLINQPDNFSLFKIYAIM